MSNQPTFETTILDMISVNGRISKKLFEKIAIPKLNKIEKLESKIKILESGLERLKLYRAYNGDDWVKLEAERALKEAREL